MGLGVTQDEVAGVVEGSTKFALEAVERELHKHLPQFLWSLVDLALNTAGKVVDAEIEKLAAQHLNRWMEPK